MYSRSKELCAFFCTSVILRYKSCSRESMLGTFSEFFPTDVDAGYEALSTSATTIGEENSVSRVTRHSCALPLRNTW